MIIHSRSKTIERFCFPSLEETNPINGIDNTNDDSNDSDVQYVENDYEQVNDKLTQKLQRLHLDDRVNVPDENGKYIVYSSSSINDFF